jgi:hypothetical protein
MSVTFDVFQFSIDVLPALLKREIAEKGVVKKQNYSQIC